MAAAIFLVTRTAQGQSEDRNLVRECIVHEDDAQTNAQIIAALIASLNVQHPTGDGFSTGEDVYPAGYFDTVEQIGATPVGSINTDGDFLAYPVRVSSFDA